jgi:fatty-acyl-CoA synthase
MDHVHLLDRRIGATWPDLSSAEKLAAFEAVPYDERIAAASTYEALRRGASHNPDAPAILFLPNADPDDTPITITHRQYFARLTQTANLFHALGVGPGDVVSFLLPLIPQAFFTLFGAEAAGISNPVNPLLEPSQLAEILRAARTKVLVALGPTPGTDIWEKVQRIRGELPDLKAIVAVNPPRDDASVVDFDAEVAKQPADRLVSGRTIAASDVAGYFHTGGTTGTPKLACHTHRNQVYQAWVVALMTHAEPGGNLLFGMPLFHVGGSLTQTLATLSTGGTLVVLSPAGWRNPAATRNAWRLVERFRPKTFSSVPTVLAAVLHLPVGDADISSLQYAAGGGSAIPVAVGRVYEDKMKLKVLEVYGMTETASVHTISYLDRPIRLGAVGHAVPYSRVRVVKIDADGRYQGDCKPDEIGVVTMHGPGVFSGYLSDSHNRNAFVEPGWVNSGDLGRLDPEGYLWITGRAKDLVIRGGHNIDPQPIEEILFQHPSVALAAMVGQPDAYAGELPVAYVQPKPGVTVDTNELIDFVRERTPERAAVPVGLFVVDPMPLTGVGKVFKPALRWDAAKRVVERMLADLAAPGRSFAVSVGAHPVHGNLIEVTVGGVPQADREALAAQVQERLGPLVMRHALHWS